MRREALEQNVRELIELMSKDQIPTKTKLNAYFQDIDETELQLNDLQVFLIFKAFLDNKCVLVAEKVYSTINNEAQWLRCFNYAILNLAEQNVIDVLLEKYQQTSPSYDLNLEISDLRLLFSVCQVGNLTVLNWLDQQRIMFDVRDQSLGQTALHIACNFDQQEVVEFLVAKTNLPICYYDNFDHSALVLALRKGHLQIAKKLIHEGAGLFERFSDDDTAALQELDLDACYFVGATLNGNAFSDKQNFSEKFLSSGKIVARLIEVLNSKRRNLDAYNLLTEFTSDNEINQQPLFEQFNIANTLIEFRDIKSRLDTMQNLQDRMTFLTKIVEMLEVGLSARAGEIAARNRTILRVVYRGVLPAAVLVTFLLSAHFMGASDDRPNRLSNLVGALSSLTCLGLLLAYTGVVNITECSTPSPTAEFLAEKAQQLTPHDLSNWNILKNKMLALAEIISHESPDEELQSLVDELKRCLYNKETLLFTLKNSLAALKDYYEKMHSVLVNSNESAVPLINPVAAINAPAISASEAANPAALFGYRLVDQDEDRYEPMGSVVVDNSNNEDVQLMPPI